MLNFKLIILFFREFASALITVMFSLPLFLILASFREIVGSECGSEFVSHSFIFVFGTGWVGGMLSLSNCLSVLTSLGSHVDTDEPVCFPVAELVAVPALVLLVLLLPMEKVLVDFGIVEGSLSGIGSMVVAVLWSGPNGGIWTFFSEPHSLPL